MCVSVVTLAVTVFYRLKTDAIKLFMVVSHCVNFIENASFKSFGDIC